LRNDWSFRIVRWKGRFQSCHMGTRGG
jgi:hypothetical protein